MADKKSDIEGLLIAVGALTSNDQRLSKMEQQDEDIHHTSIRSGKLFTESAGVDTADEY